jgi:hypothetical protein
MSNYADLSFSDEEIIALFLFGVIDNQTSTILGWGFLLHVYPVLAQV